MVAPLTYINFALVSYFSHTFIYQLLLTLLTTKFLSQDLFLSITIFHAENLLDVTRT